MMDHNRRPARTVGIADHLWDTYALMAEQMGSERDALINQALFTFARLNGFLEAGRVADRAASETPVSDEARSLPTPAPRSSPPVFTPAPAPARFARDEQTPLPMPAPSRAVPALDAEPPTHEAEAEKPFPHDLERLKRAKAKGGSPTDAALPAPHAAAQEADRFEPKSAGADAPGGAQLYLLTEAGDLDKISKDRFIIGRGKHCDFVINSGKVSREHAVIVREGDAFFIEDLGSSNGTWFNKQRIKRRRIEEGDEYFVCNEKIKLVLR